ncbi:MAG: N-formylglutamate amidohydrolase, partial [Candidatus Puniceispirillum sp.]
DLHGHTLAKPVGAALADRITSAGFSLGWNHPYAGGHITRHYGRATSRRQSVQIEVNRRLYMTADLTIKPAGLARLQHLIAGIASDMGEQILAAV